jgi:hypothetical protein
MRRVDAENWVAFLLSLKGQVGTFLLGDPNCFDAQGSATALRNLFLYTEQFDNAYWAKGAVSITANSVVAPDGYTTADTLVEDTANSVHQMTRVISATEGLTYTLSVYMKAQSARNFRVFLPSGIFGVECGAIFNPSDGSVVSVQGGAITNVQSVGNGWFRVSISKTATATATASMSYRLLSGGTNVYLGDGVSGVYLWGAQFETGPTATTYQGVVDAYGPFVNGAGQTGDTLVIDGCSPNVTGFLLPGDYIQIGSASATQLYKVLTQVDTDGSGGATLDIWPDLRSSPANDAVVVVANTKGRFRLRENVQQWQINEISSYGITFDCVEAI